MNLSINYEPRRYSVQTAKRPKENRDPQVVESMSRIKETENEIS